MSITKEKIKSVLAGIMFLDDTCSISDDTKIFSELALSSIDFIDLVFELKKISGSNSDADEIWPFPNMILDDQYYANGAWTEKGLAKIERYLRVKVEEKATLRDIYPFFTVNYLHYVLTAVYQ